MNLTEKQADTFAVYEQIVHSALVQSADINSACVQTLLRQVKEEFGVQDVLDIDITVDQTATIAIQLATVAKAIRLGGEFPHYIAKVIALWFYSVAKVDSGSIKDAVINDCALVQEKELVGQIVEAFAVMPNLDTDDIKKIKLMQEAYRKGYYYERVNRGCAQCCIAAVSDVTGKESLEMFRAANGFAAGMGLMGDGVCGGYSGGVLSMGLFAGRRKEFFDGDKEEKELCMALVAKLHDKYISTFDTVICHRIHEHIFGRAFHITQASEKDAFEEAGAHSKDKCPAVVAIASAWTVEILYDAGFIDGGNNIE